MITMPERFCLNVADGYNGATVNLDPQPLMVEAEMVKLGVQDKPWLIRWVRKSDYLRAVIPFAIDLS